MHDRAQAPITLHNQVKCLSELSLLLLVARVKKPNPDHRLMHGVLCHLCVFYDVAHQQHVLCLGLKLGVQRLSLVQCGDQWVLEPDSVLTFWAVFKLVRDHLYVRAWWSQLAKSGFDHFFDPSGEHDKWNTVLR